MRDDQHDDVILNEERVGRTVFGRTQIHDGCGGAHESIRREDFQIEKA